SRRRTMRHSTRCNGCKPRAIVFSYTPIQIPYLHDGDDPSYTSLHGNSVTRRQTATAVPQLGKNLALPGELIGRRNLK
ncbi:MAG: hypothetical protein ACREX0_20490, partial [Noviherbaspirillum sp.]